jgi:hypothetical protein
MTDYLSKKFLNYTTSVPREEIYVHSDRDEYISGEDLWFNIYLIDRKSLKPSSESKIAYFELLNPENRPIVQKRIWLDGGFGPGQIVLPDTLSTGTYTVRAYTSWMKNFMPVNCFTKDIHIYNAFSNRKFKDEVNRGKVNDSKVSAKIDPAIPYAGLTLKEDNLKSDFLEIDIITNDRYRFENDNQFYLFIQTRGNINHASSERISDEQTKIHIPKNHLLSGINQITVFNSKGQPVAERFIYTPDKEDTGLIIHSPDSFGLRNKISLNLEFGNRMTTALNSTHLSISVTPVTTNHHFTDIKDYMLFGSEFGLLNEYPLRDKKVNEITPEVMDSLLQNMKSNWIDWKTILADTLPVFKYQIENETHYLSGKLLTGNMNLADSGKVMLLSVPGKIASFQYAKTDKNGKFSFRIPIDMNVSDLIIQPDVSIKNSSVSIETPFSDQYPNSGKIDTTNNLIPDYISTWSVNHQVTKIYGTSYIGEKVTPVVSTPRLKRFYGKPDNELIMKNYIALPVMEEVFFELLAGVSLKNNKSGYKLTIADAENNYKPFITSPGLFIDGVAVKDPSVIAGLDPELVEKIDVVRERYSVGDYLFYGIVNIITKAGDFSKVALPDYAIRLPYRTIDSFNSFVSRDYSSSESMRGRVPDFRNTLYWNPSVIPDKEGKASVEFWTSDYAADFEVNIEGITSDGKMITLKKIVRIKR